MVKMNARVFEYFEWLKEQVSFEGGRVFTESEDRILGILFLMDFEFSMPMDKNRAKDGLILRKIWGNRRLEAGEKVDLGAIFEGKEQCSMLEMLLGLAIRMEDLLFEPGQNHISKWFWEMIDNSEWPKILEKEGVKELKKAILAWTTEKPWPKAQNPFKKAHFSGQEIWYQMHEYVGEKCGF